MNRKIHGGQTYLSRRRLVENDEQGGEEEEEEEEDKVEKMWWTELYNSDEFRMYDFKVRRCMKVRNHDWTDCPFAHPTEKARRRDPRRYHYSGNLCPSFRRDGMCHRGEKCEFAHGIFEFWLHPSRYRTMPCKDGRICRRKVCFFAHNPNQLRLTATSTRKDEKKPTKTSTPFNHSSYHSILSPPVSPPAVSSPVITGIVKSMETIELHDPKLGFSWVDQVSPEEEEEGSVPDLEWVNELVM